MCTTCFSTASDAVSWGTPALAAGAAAVMTGVRLRFPSRRAVADQERSPSVHELGSRPTSPRRDEAAAT